MRKRKEADPDKETREKEDASAELFELLFAATDVNRSRSRNIEESQSGSKWGSEGARKELRRTSV